MESSLALELVRVTEEAARNPPGGQEEGQEQC